MAVDSDGDLLRVLSIASCSLDGVTCFKTVVVCYQSPSLNYL